MCYMSSRVAVEELFSETQYLRGAPRILMLLVAAPITLLLGALAFRQVALGESVGKQQIPDPALLTIFVVVGLLLPFLLATMRLKTTITQEGVTVSLRPLYRRSVEIAVIEDVESIPLDPLKDVGGWGIKRSKKTGTALMMGRSGAVRLRLTEDRRFTIGSRRPDELVESVRRAKRSRPGGTGT